MSDYNTLTNAEVRNTCWCGAPHKTHEHYAVKAAEGKREK